MRKKLPPQQLHESQYELHIPVLLEATLRVLNPKKGESYLDLTAGYGGHASAVIERVNDASLVTLVDRDDMAVRQLQPLVERGARLLHLDFLTATKQLIAEGKQFDMVLGDLGVSSPQLDRAERGFSFKNDGPLDMRMDRRQELTAETLVNTYSAKDLAFIIQKYGEEPPKMSTRIAEAIVEARPLHTTAELASVIATTYRGGYRKVHPATRTFQALRIALNEELRQVEALLPLLPKLLKPGGRVAIISFHSLEDRLVKDYFTEQDRSGYEAELKLLTKKPISGATEDVHNPRSRSAKLRAAVKIKT
jgi:16S rRNA (cytosine1402-N4)-methyltransferase